jgi:acyl-CoA thioester hydrolase
MPRIHQRTLTVSAESIDAVGHVNNREYLRWMEDIAVEHSAAQGWPMERYFKGGNAWVASTHFIEYLRPAFAGDQLDIYTWIGSWDRRTSVRRYAVTRRRKLVARGETCWTFVELASGRACDLPADVTAAFLVVADDDPELKSLGLGRRARASQARPAATVAAFAGRPGVGGAPCDNPRLCADAPVGAAASHCRRTRRASSNDEERQSRPDRSRDVRL